MSLFENIFTTSCPETRPGWCDSIGTWRVPHLDRLEKGLQQHPRIDYDVYAEHDGDVKFWVSYRDNRDPEDHSNRLCTLSKTLRAEGLSARCVLRRGRVVGVRVSDKI